MGFRLSNGQLLSVCLRGAVNLSFGHVHINTAAAIADGFVAFCSELPELVAPCQIMM